MNSPQILRNFTSFLKNPRKFILFFGVPGSGKGTYAALLSKSTGFLNISMGDELRKLIKTAETPLFQRISEEIQQGKLIEDAVIFKILEIQLQKSASGVILDGFPRNVAQMLKFEEKHAINLVINCVLDEEILVEKLLGRRSCENCGKSYNLCNIAKKGYDMPAILPQKSGFCDICQGKLVAREDDTETVIRKRMREYAEKTAILLDLFRKKGVLVDFAPKRGVKDFPEFFAKVVKPKL